MRLLVVGVALAAVLVGCSEAAAPSMFVPSTGPCAGIPLVDRQNPPDELPLTADPGLEVKFPTQIDGLPLTELSSGSYLETLCLVGGEAALASLPAGVGVNDINVASAKATVDGQSRTISAYRWPGQSGTALIPIIGALAGAVSPTGEPKFAGDLTVANVGGKEVKVWQGSAVDDTAYLYSIGDTLFIIEGVTPSQADKVLAALP